MANAVFSPRDFKAFVIEETVTGNNGGAIDSPNITSNMFQLDVDSISFPTLNLNQIAEIRSNTGRAAHVNDFFQDNDYRATEISLSGRFHNDAGHGMLLQSVAGANLAAAAADVTIGATPTLVAGQYNESETEKTFTLVLAPPDYTDGKNIIMVGCLCTNFSINADMGTDGGQYKFSATISSGRVPVLNNTSVAAGTAFGGTYVDMSGLDISELKIYNKAPVLTSFNVTVDSPAVFTGISEGKGYNCYGRAAEIAVTATSSVKYDSTTSDLINTFDTQSGALIGNFLNLQQTTATAGSIQIANGVLTNVAFNEGDIMMLDIEMKALTNGSANLIEFNLAS